MGARQATFWRSGLYLGCLSLVAGCSQPKTSTVSGEVRFQGKPVVDGRVIFHYQEGKRGRAEAAIHEGRYSIPECLPGPVKITIEPGGAVAGPVGGPAPAAGGATSAGAVKAADLPARYRDPAQTTLELTIQPGKMDVPIYPPP